MDRKILYRLTTKDRIKSEIKEADVFMPVIYTAVQSGKKEAGIYIETSELLEGATHAMSDRRIYSMRRHTTVEFVEYEED